MLALYMKLEALLIYALTIICAQNSLSVLINKEMNKVQTLVICIYMLWMSGARIHCTTHILSALIYCTIYILTKLRVAQAFIIYGACSQK